MQKYIEIFPIASVILFFIYMSCNEETHSETSPYEETQLIGYSSSDTCLTHLRQYNEDDTAEVDIVVDSFDIIITHNNAFLNCCLDSVSVQFMQAGDTLRLYENEIILGSPCDCLCPYEVNFTIGISEPGTYLVEIFTYSWIVYQEWVEVL